MCVRSRAHWLEILQSLRFSGRNLAVHYFLTNCPRLLCGILGSPIVNSVGNIPDLWKGDDPIGCAMVSLRCSHPFLTSHKFVGHEWVDLFGRDRRFVRPFLASVILVLT